MVVRDSAPAPGRNPRGFLMKIGDYSGRIREACPVTAFTGNFAAGTPPNLKKEKIFLFLNLAEFGDRGPAVFCFLEIALGVLKEVDLGDHSKVALFDC